ncbi:histidine-containing phosphotransfer protein 2-like [Dioscorea cayenensis subsp. rotundata]|uniref:Histidine-containing phosphotransfer protein n=1 Tax=Dioscorea cayennensis subsp. rotundata TaxID=55577 RepID=A0AB40BGG8_DIOCR|nr:histidine-containing phosphotransfer protein 2-like [Dioscorea cayenensis subsp. rotundata]
MASVNYKEQLAALVDSMLQEGLLDEQFTQLQTLQDETSPGFVAEVIAMFCGDTGTVFNEIETIMNQAVIDFQNVDPLVHRLKGSSCTVGAPKMKLACVQYRQFRDANDRQGCLSAVNLIKDEYNILRNKFETMLNLERMIQAGGTNKPNGK